MTVFGYDERLSTSTYAEIVLGSFMIGVLGQLFSTVFKVPLLAALSELVAISLMAGVAVHLLWDASHNVGIEDTVKLEEEADT